MHPLIKKLGATRVIDILEPLIVEKRLTRIEEVLAKRLHGIQLAMESPNDPHNAFAAVRSAEAFGITEIHIIAPEGEASAIKPVTQGAFYWVNIHYHDSLADFLAHIKQEKLTLAGGALNVADPCSISNVPIGNPLCLILGNESRGLSNAAKAACDIIYQIPMVGMSESLNLSVSAAISLLDTSSRKRQAQQDSDLNETQLEMLKAKYYINSVNGKTIETLLKG